MAMKSLWTIGVCYKEITEQELNTEDKDERGVYSFEKENFTLVCLFGIRDTIWEEVPRSIAQCHDAGI